MDKLKTQDDNEAPSNSSEKATAVHAPRIAPTYLNRFKKMVSNVSSPAPVNRKHSSASSRVNDRGWRRKRTKSIPYSPPQVKQKKDFVDYK
nr:RNA demethylase ALKBH5-like [Ipomoea batatas]GME08646.1 RNA demethylase ALKBH5-like [Ipomoea batatas]GME18655.1 RNA demethylase ALKBH5-like [Ipomoea batatas]